MGFFSWKCAECNESVSNKWSSRPKDSDCHLVTPHRTYHDKAYDGYGYFNGFDVYELLGGGVGDAFRLKAINAYHSGNRDSLPFKIKLVHTRCAGKTYDELNESENCPSQGFFYDDDEFEIDEGRLPTNEEARLPSNEISSKSWRLQDADGKPVVVGQKVTNGDGEMFGLAGGIPPHKSSSTGRVYGQWLDEDDKTVGDYLKGTYFPTVFDLKWVDLDLEVGEDLIGEEAYP